MAAQPLTKGRFVQIIIMLIVLIGAFTWRTINHSQALFVDCKYQETCVFNVKNSIVEAVFTRELIKLNVDQSIIDISTPLIVVKPTKNQKEWALPDADHDSGIKMQFTLENNDVYQVSINNYQQ
ncbi:hypothetical protein KP803_17160 [Vibrio sp. ZSDE26]|uniref:Uncharacterized protein n=1 Tax=Vibrio amylolyticus TaxID=2847292 RepID=A0A9X2BJA3_9VIBR|nr:hypothetical protein [Vibrio amylolyticus]MCK6265010.1 hypothetical protein [Vibrio amylolyticus]